MMNRMWAIIVVMGIVSACGRQPPLPDALPQELAKQCLDTAQDISDCR